MTKYMDTPAEQLRGLQDRLGGLAGGVRPAIARAADQAAPSTRKLIDYAQLAMEFAPQFGEIIARLRGQGRAAIETVVPPAGPLARVARRPYRTAAFALGVAAIAYAVWSGKLTGLVKRSG